MQRRQWSASSGRLSTIRKLIQRSAPKQETFAFLDQHPIIRNLSDYGDVVRVNFRKEAATATAILDRFLHHAKILTITSKS